MGAPLWERHPEVLTKEARQAAIAGADRAAEFGKGPAVALVGVQDVEAEHFRSVRSVETGSWLGRMHQGLGLGREMREAVLHLAFAGLGAEEALSGAFEDNAASLATSRAIGYDENGEARGRRRDGSGRTIRFRLGRDAWQRGRRADIEIVGLEGCLDMFVGSPG